MKWVDIKAGARAAVRDPHPLFIISIVILVVGIGIAIAAAILKFIGPVGVVAFGATLLLSIIALCIWNEARDAQEKREYRESMRKGGEYD